MKILLDTCVWGGVKAQLISANYDVIWTGDWLEDLGDEFILSFAYNQGRILITLDKDFGQLAILQRIPHCGIIRLVNVSARQQGNICIQVIQNYGYELISGSIITAELNRIRIRKAN